MKRWFSLLGMRISMAIGLDRLGEKFFRMFIMHTAFCIFVNLQGVFINTLFFRLTGNSDIVMYYNIIGYVVSASFMLVSANVIKRFSPVTSIKIGIIMYIFMYMIFFTVMNDLVNFMPFIAILNGMGGGFYWLAYTNLLTGYTGDENRDVAVGAMGVMGGVVGLTMPTISGYVISLFDDFTGYNIMFGISFAVAVITIILSTRLIMIKVEKQKTNYKLALKLAFKSKVHRTAMLSEYVKCLREGTLAFFLNVLLFEIINNEMVVGVNTLLVGLTGVFAAWMYGKYITPARRIQSVFWATSILLVAGACLFVKLDSLTIILFSMINSFFNAFLLNPSFAMVYNAFSINKESLSVTNELYSIKEFFVAAGRVTGVCATMLMPKSQFGYVAAIVGLTITQYLLVYLADKTSKLVMQARQVVTDEG